MAAQFRTADPRRTLPDIQELRDTIYAMDALSQEGFSEIESIAELVLVALETPTSYQHINDIALALRVIREKASEIKNYIRNEAEEVGCNHVDKSERRRWEAQWEAYRSR